MNITVMSMILFITAQRLLTIFLRGVLEKNKSIYLYGYFDLKVVNCENSCIELYCVVLRLVYALCVLYLVSYE